MVLQESIQLLSSQYTALAEQSNLTALVRLSYCFRESCSNALGQVFKQDPLLQRKATGSFAGIGFAELVLVYDVVTQRAHEF